MLICTCPVDVDCIALGSHCECFPWCDYLKDDGLEDDYLSYDKKLPPKEEREAKMNAAEAVENKT